MLLLTKARCRLAVLCLVLGTIGLPILGPFVKAAHAATPGQWVDQATITVNGKKYIDNNVSDGNYQFHENGNDDPSKCVDVLKEFKDDKGKSTEPSKASTVNLVTWNSFLSLPGTGAPGDSAICAVDKSTQITLDPATKANATKASASGGVVIDHSCEAQGKLAWFVCPFIEMLDGIFNWLDTQIQALLEVNKDSYTNPKLYKAWSSIRNIAYIILIPIMLVMVIGTALGFQALDAYTVKKALPRMVAAILFISLSWYICGFLIGFSNVVGSGVIGLITGPFSLDGNITLASLFTPSAGGLIAQGVGVGAVGVAAILVVAANGLIGIVLLYFLGAVLAIFIAFLILVIRQMFILALLLTAPLAILAWIFPGNDKAWKLWWGTFSKLLMMFPLITGLIGVGRVFASLIATTPAGGVQGGLLNPLLKITAYIVPYVLIPLTFKFAGGAFASLAGMANSRSTGIFGRLKKGRQKQWQQVGHNIKHGRALRGGDKETGRAFKANEKIMRLSHLGKAGFNPKNWGGALETAVQDTERAERDEIVKDPDALNSVNYDNIMRVLGAAYDLPGFRIELRNQDDERMKEARENSLAEYRASGKYTEAEAQEKAEEDAVAASRYQNPDDLERDAQRAERLRKKYSARAIQQVGVLQMEKGGTAEKSGGKSLEMLIKASGGDSAILMNLVAEWRAAAMAGGQATHGGGSQGAVYSIARKLQDGVISSEEADIQLAAAAIQVQGAGVVSHQGMKAHDMDNVIKALGRRRDEAIESGDMDKVDREMALVNNIHTALPSTNPQFADKFAAGVLNQTIDVKNLSEDQKIELDAIINVKQNLAPIERHVQVELDAAGKRVAETGAPVASTVTEVQYVQRDPVLVETRNVISVQQVHNARRGSPVYNAYTKDYGSQEAQARAGTPGPGAPVVPPTAPPAAGG